MRPEPALSARQPPPRSSLHSAKLQPQSPKQYNCVHVAGGNVLAVQEPKACVATGQPRAVDLRPASSITDSASLAPRSRHGAHCTSPAQRKTRPVEVASRHSLACTAALARRGNVLGSIGARASRQPTGRQPASPRHIVALGPPSTEVELRVAVCVGELAA